jgi:hypothetical protein
VERGGRGASLAHLKRHDRESYLQYETEILRASIEQRRQAIEKYAGSQPPTIVIDRYEVGGFLHDQEYRQLLASMNMSQSPTLSDVDSIMYLPSIARIDTSLYEQFHPSNGARYETSWREAAAVCDATLRAVEAHPVLDVVWGNGQTFDWDIAAAAERIISKDQPQLYKERISSERLLALRSSLICHDADGSGESSYVLTDCFREKTAHSLDGRDFILERSVAAASALQLSYRLFVDDDPHGKIISGHDYRVLQTAAPTKESGASEVLRLLLPESDRSMRLWTFERSFSSRSAASWEVSTIRPSHAQHLALPRPDDVAELIQRGINASDLA